MTGLRAGAFTLRGPFVGNQGSQGRSERTIRGSVREMNRAPKAHICGWLGREPQMRVIEGELEVASSSGVSAAVVAGADAGHRPGHRVVPAHRLVETRELAAELLLVGSDALFLL